MDYYILGGEISLKIKALKNTKSAHVDYSIPVTYNGQIPLLLDVKGNIRSYKIINEIGNINRKIRFYIGHMNKNEIRKIKMNYWVISKRISQKDIPKNAPFPNKKNLSDSLKKWLASSRSIQSDSIFIKLISNILKGFTKDLIWFSKKVMLWTCYHGLLVGHIKKKLVEVGILNRLFLPDSYWYKMEDSLSSLFFGSLCPGKANLQVAILRAAGIPARVLIDTSTFYGKNSWLDAQHYIMELYCPEYGWIKAQSGVMPSPSEDGIIIRIVYPEDENLAGDGFSDYGGTPTWFWTSDGIILDFQRDLINYKPPKTKKFGTPAIRGWKEKKINIPDDIEDKVISLSKRVWNIFVKKETKKDITSMQKEGLDLILNLRFNGYIKNAERIIKEYGDRYK